MVGQPGYDEVVRTGFKEAAHSVGHLMVIAFGEVVQVPFSKDPLDARASHSNDGYFLPRPQQCIE